MRHPDSQLRELLDAQFQLHHRSGFIAGDPIQVPHHFSRREDIEIAGFLTALIAWGRRDLIIRSAWNLVNLLQESPFEFVSAASENELKQIKKFVHRTFNGDDLVAIVRSLRKVYAEHGGLENAMNVQPEDENVFNGLVNLRHAMVNRRGFPPRTGKHIADAAAGSAAKRINMFLRWMVRTSKGGVDFGLWNSIQPAQLICPLDVHSGTVARKLGLLRRKQNDWTAAVELTRNLAKYDATDPVKFDLALFGMGVSGWMKK